MAHYAQMFDSDGDGFFISSRSKSGLIQKAKKMVRNKEAGMGGFLFEDHTGIKFGEINVDKEGKPIYKKKF